MFPPVILLLIGMAAVVGAIAILRLNAFVALIGAAILVSLLAPGDAASKITRVAEGFGPTARSWTPLSAIVGTTAMVSTLVLAVLLPLR